LTAGETSDLFAAAGTFSDALDALEAAGNREFGQRNVIGIEFSIFDEEIQTCAKNYE
jgi:hypothetical protein